MIIAIDGPAGSGKSTTARLVAERLGFGYVNTGAMYRAVGLASLRDRIDAAKIDEVWLRRIDLRVEYSGGQEMVVYLGDSNVSDQLRSQEVGEAASRVSAVKAVRSLAVKMQQELVRSFSSGLVLEGRDIGTVVAPQADVKVYMDAAVEERAQRRLDQLALSGAAPPTLQELIEEIRDRDERDRTRKDSPLVIAEDAIVLDTTKSSIEEQVEFVVALVQNYPSVAKS